MKTFILIAMALFLTSCGAVRAVHDDVQAPPETQTTSGATEDLIAQKAAALAREKVDAANERAAKAALRAAKSDGDRLAAEMALDAAKKQHDKDKADAEALAKALGDQRTAENAARFDRGYWFGGLLLLLAGFLLYEGNLLGASRAALAGLGVIVAVQALSFAATHEGLILGAATGLLLVELAWHYRARLMATEQALVHSVRGYPWAEAERHVQAALFAAWMRSLSVFERLEVLLHLRANPVKPPATTTNPPTA